MMDLKPIVYLFPTVVLAWGFLFSLYIPNISHKWAPLRSLCYLTLYFCCLRHSFQYMNQFLHKKGEMWFDRQYHKCLQERKSRRRRSTRYQRLLQSTSLQQQQQQQQQQPTTTTTNQDSIKEEEDELRRMLEIQQKETFQRFQRVNSRLLSFIQLLPWLFLYCCEFVGGYSQEKLANIGLFTLLVCSCQFSNWFQKLFIPIVHKNGQFLVYLLDYESRVEVAPIIIDSDASDEDCGQHCDNNEEEKLTQLEKQKNTAKGRKNNKELEYHEMRRFDREPSSKMVS